MKGERGDHGDQGLTGRIGYRGLKGFQGLRGLPGLQGPEGLKGERGFIGPPGLAGLDGLRGSQGLPGDDAPPPPPPKSRGFIFTRHSQSVSIPRCPVNTNLLWEGYSYLSAVGSGRAVGQDLGAGGSCLQRFSAMPFMFCNLNNVCSYAENNDDSLWLATAEPMPMSMTPIPSREMEKYISRCAVCDSSTKLIALHSQSMDIPDCPQGWEEAWVGYSYYMQTSDSHGNSHQNLVSPGSCLEEFRAQPTIECHGRGTCNFFDGMTSFWMAVIEDSEQFKRPRQQTLKADQTSKVSRCSVCRKKPNIRIARPAAQLPRESLAFSSREPEQYIPQSRYDQPAPPPSRYDQSAHPPRRRPQQRNRNRNGRVKKNSNSDE